MNTEKRKERKPINSKKIYGCIILGLAVLTFLDRFTKYLAEVYLKGTEGVTLIDNTLRLQYLENRGAAFGILQNKQIVFWILTVLFILAAIYFFKKIEKTDYFVPVIAAVTMLLAGAIGNFIDRLMNQYVVDFIYFQIIDFPIFNVADVYVTISVIILLVLLIFHYKEGDFSCLSFKKKSVDHE